MPTHELAQTKVSRGRAPFAITSFARLLPSQSDLKMKSSKLTRISSSRLCILLSHVIHIRTNDGELKHSYIMLNRLGKG